MEPLSDGIENIWNLINHTKPLVDIDNESDYSFSEYSGDMLDVSNLMDDLNLDDPTVALDPSQNNSESEPRVNPFRAPYSATL